MYEGMSGVEVDARAEARRGYWISKSVCVPVIPEAWVLAVVPPTPLRTTEMEVEPLVVYSTSSCVPKIARPQSRKLVVEASVMVVSEVAVDAFTATVLEAISNIG